MDDERKKLITNKATNELARLISYVNLGSQEMPIEEYYVQLAREDIVIKNSSRVI